jgi:hypothetical protein
MANRNDEQHQELLEALHSLGYAIDKSSKTKQTVELLGSSAIPFVAAAGAVDGRCHPTQVANVLLGWSVRETTGLATARLIFRDGGNSSDDEIGAVTLAANESTRDLFPFGISLVKGLFLDVQAGAVAGTVYLGNT